MAVGDVTKGTRICDLSKPWDLKPGEYFIQTQPGGARHIWCMSPNGYGPMHLSTWTLTEHEDGTATVSPSIFCDPPNGWHGFLQRGEWREA